MTVFSPHRFAHFPGDVAATFRPGEAAGPDTSGREYRFVVSAAYDPTTDTTTVAYNFSPLPAEFSAALEAEAAALPPATFARPYARPCTGVPLLGWKV